MVYLLHFDRPYEHARHFVGAARDIAHLERILANPEAECTSPLLIAAHAAGVQFEIGNLWHEPALRAVDIRRSRHHARHCTTCTPPTYRRPR